MAENVLEKYDFEKDNPIKKYMKVAAGTSLVLTVIGMGSSVYYLSRPTPDIIKNYQNMQTTLKTLESETESEKIKRLENLPYENKEIKNSIDKMIEEVKLTKNSYLENAIISAIEDISILEKNSQFIKSRKECDDNMKKFYISFFGAVGFGGISIVLSFINEMFISPFKRKKK